MSARKPLHKALTLGWDAMVVEVAFTEGVRCYGRDVAMLYLSLMVVEYCDIDC